MAAVQMLALQHMLPYRSSLGCVQAESIRTPLPTCISEQTRADAQPIYESGATLLKALMALTPAFEAARGQDGPDPELQYFINTRVPSADNVAADLAICGYHKDVSMRQNACQLRQCGTSCCKSPGSSCSNSYVLP